MPRTPFRGTLLLLMAMLTHSQSNSIVIRDVLEIEFALDLRLAGKAPCLHLSQKVIRFSKNKRSGLLASQGSCPLLQILVDFAFEIWEREPLPLIKSWFYGYLWTFFVRVYRKNYRSLTRTDLTNRRPSTWRRSAAI